MPRNDPPTNLPAVLPPQTLAVCGVTISGPVMSFPMGLTESDWMSFDAPFSAAEMGTPWWRGDWYNWGEANYQHFAQALALPDKKKRTYQNNGSVCRQYTPEDRAETWERLSFSHHASVAYVDKPIRARLLALAVENDWSVIELRDAVGLLTKQGEEADAAALGAGVPGNQEFLPVEMPLTLKSVAALIHDHLTDKDDLRLLREWLAEMTGDAPPPAPPPLLEETAVPWPTHAARLIREAIEEASAFSDEPLPATYLAAAERLVKWIEGQEGPHIE